jgi:hypothetical protein
MADPVEKPPEPETWEKSSKDIVAGAVAWMYQACKDQGHKWNTLIASDPIVADGHRMVVADAERRNIPVEDIDVTYTDLLAAMHAYGKEETAKARKDRAAARAEAEKAAKPESEVEAAPVSEMEPEPTVTAPVHVVSEPPPV